jgi:predicted nucleotidyltransferase
MRSVFTTFASSRFVDQAEVIEALRPYAQRLKAQFDEVAAVYLFGSFATGTATPRSDADIVVEISSGDAYLRKQVWEAAMGIFMDAPVPVDLFVMSSVELAEGRGVASRVAQEGMQLG